MGPVPLIRSIVGLLWMLLRMLLRMLLLRLSLVPDWLRVRLAWRPWVDERKRRPILVDGRSRRAESLLHGRHDWGVTGLGRIVGAIVWTRIGLYAGRARDK